LQIIFVLCLQKLRLEQVKFPRNHVLIIWQKHLLRKKSDFVCQKCFKFNLHRNNCCCTDKSTPTYWNRTINKPNLLKHVTRHWICSCWVCIRQLYYLSFWKSREVCSRESTSCNLWRTVWSERKEYLKT
jgi:hypothetical protein